MLSVIGSLAVSSSAEVRRRPAAAFFDLDKTIIAKSSTLAYGPSFYRNGLISRGHAVRGAVAQLLFARHGASHDRMEQIRAHFSQLCRGWPAGRVREIVARHLDELIVPYVYDEARALLDAHRAAGEDVIIVSTSGVELVTRSGPCWVPAAPPPAIRSPTCRCWRRWATRTR
jgi:phosphoserine phosphatase